MEKMIILYLIRKQKNYIVNKFYILKIESCKSSCCILHLADDMDHISYRLYKDLINPFTEFLLQIKYY